MLGGYWQRLLRVDLSSGQITVEQLSEEYLRTYLGGSSLATKILIDEVAPGVKGLDKDNKVIFALGPYQGTSAPGSGKWAVVSKSPLTNTFAVSTAGASWGHKLKKAGYDVLVIEGQAEQPVILSINEETINIVPAGDIWGKDAVETTPLVKEKLGNKKMSVAAIGPAGEKEVAVACIIADEHSAAGRCGIGAVMGNKKLKAIAVFGNKSVAIAEKDKFSQLRKTINTKLKAGAQAMWRPYGTSGTLEGCAETGDLPVKYWTGDYWPAYKGLTGEAMEEQLNSKTWPCFACTVGCHRHISVDNPPGYPGLKLEGAGPEYETLGTLGSNCLNDDIVGVAIGNDICNRLGIDTVSAGSFVAFIMECYELGILTKDDLRGIEAKWGDVEVLCELLRQIGNREGFGALFARGIRPAAQEIGQGAEHLTMEVKNLDFAAHDPRSYFSLAINYATGTRGACHCRGYSHFGECATDPSIGHQDKSVRFNMDGKSKIAITFQDWCAVQDSLVVCMFMYSVGISGYEHRDILNAITGWQLSMQEFLLIGERAWNMQRLINLGDGLTRADDKLPKKVFIPGKQGFRAGKAPYNFDAYLEEYYQLRGWDKRGVPTSAKLFELGIS